jgi:sterol 3beta-glucosyltransferase
MRITLLAYGSRGDVQPYVALALGLKARGHAPVLAAPENFKAFVEGFGIGYAPLTGDTRAMLENPKVLGHMQAGENREFFSSVTKAMQPIMDPLWDSALQACRGSDMVLSSPVTEFMAYSAAEAAGARCALSFLAPQAPSHQFASMAFSIRDFHLPFLNRFSHYLFESGWWWINKQNVARARQRWGLPPQSSPPIAAFRAKGGLALFGFSPLVFPRPSDWPASHVVTGAWRMPASASAALSKDSSDEGFVAWLEDGPPPVYFGFGSMPVPDHEGFMEMASELCEELGMRALIGAGWTDVSMAACDLPDNLAVVEQADHAWLFPQCAAIAHHGGSGTTHAALASGVPSVVCSFFADQPLWGRQVEKLGVGTHMRFQDMSYARLKRALEGALRESVSEKAALLGAALQAENGVETACEALEKALR